jgi:hypothetical protein
MPKREISRDQAKDTGMAMALICLLIAYWGERPRLVILAILLLVVDMVWPPIFHYPAQAWFGLAHFMGAIVSRILLSVLFFGLVTPLGLVRRLGGADPMQRKKWKQGDDSVFRKRDHTYSARDIEQPY